MTAMQTRIGAGQDYALLGGRLLMASLFLFSGTQKIFDYQGAAAYAASAGIPLAKYLMPIVIVVEIGAGLAIVVGRATRPAAIVLALWMAWTGPWFHRFWEAPPQMWQMMIDDFFHHWVMIGGMIYLAVFGPGRLVLGGSAAKT